MAEPYDDWLKRKLAQEPIELRQAWTVSRKWERITGGRILFAELTLTAEPSSAFAYLEKVVWPTDYLYFKHCVLDGILDGVLIDLARAPTYLSFTLNAINWHEEHSVPRAYYRAAREAIGEIFASDERAFFAPLFDEGSSE
ncbi:MAG TPA: hypothetical protein PLP93_08150 [Nitrosomonas sp.]|nr:hypothetical protein [Nitrosomonas sp.]HRB46175.1 hypothetical protein [Nitrosomonas sp.]